MAKKMQLAELEFVDEGHPNSQMVAVLSEPRTFLLKHAVIPEPSDDELRVRIIYVGICGSDIETYRGIRSAEFVSLPVRLGHEVAGIVDKVGKRVSGVRSGDVVTCRYIWGAFAQYIICNPFNVKVVSGNIPMKEVSVLEVMPGILHAAEIADISPSTNVLIIGQGVSGLVLTQVVSLFSPKNLVVTDLHDKKLKLAKKYGATHAYRIPDPDTPTMEVVGSDFPDGFDVVIPCLLQGDGMVDAVDCAAFCGKIVMYGCIGTCNRPLDFFKVHRKRLEIYSTEPRRDIDMRRYFQEGLQLATDGLVKFSEMITHIFSLDRISEAFRLRDDKTNSEVIHVLIDCSGGNVCNQPDSGRTREHGRGLTK
jgi:threonine dehydrogenase-like Zn-dependent dehydrogenase